MEEGKVNRSGNNRGEHGQDMAALADSRRKPEGGGMKSNGLRQPPEIVLKEVGR